MKVKYIVVEDEYDIKCNSIEDVVKALVDENYYELTEQARREVLIRKAAANSINVRMISNEKDLSGFVLDNEITYILSLLKQENVYLLENANNRELTKDIELLDNAKNYVVVNNFADEILEKYRGNNNYKNIEKIDSNSDKEPPKEDR